MTEGRICSKINLNIYTYLIKIQNDIQKKEICWYEGEFVYDKSGGK